MVSIISPTRVPKGVIVGGSPLKPLPNAIVFQYNPDTLTDMFQVQTIGYKGIDYSEILHGRSAPVETNTRYGVAGRYIDPAHQQLRLAAFMRKVANAI